LDSAAIGGGGVMNRARLGQVRVLLVDDHPVVRTGMRFVLEQDGRLAVIGEAGRGREAAYLAVELRPDVVLMDINLPDISGLEATKLIKAASPEIRVLVVSLHKEPEYVLGMLEAGADGYLVKHCEPDELRSGVLQAHGGERVLHQSVLHAVISKAIHGPATVTAEALSQRECEVLQLLAQGATSKEIAIALGLRPKTVENHRARILDKLGVSNSASAVRAAVARGLISAVGTREPSHAAGFGH
jgi:two-component system response regulator NreC